MPTVRTAPPPETSDASPMPSPAGPAHVARRLLGPSVLALFDQFVVSGTRFATTILVGRAAGPDELGVYSLAMTVVLMIACAQEALLVKPYIVYHGDLDESERARYAGSVVSHSLVGGLTVALTLLVLAATPATRSWASPQVLMAMGAIVPSLLGWELVRRLAFAHMRFDVAVAADVAVASLQLAGLGLLWWHGWLSVTTTFLVIGASCGLVVLAAIAAGRFDYRMETSRFLPDWSRNWKFGRWSFAAQLSGLVHGSIVHWMLAMFHGTYETGLFVACQSIVLIANPLLLALSNLAMPQATRTLASSGRARLRAYTLAASVGMVAVMTGLLAVLYVFAEPLVRLLFGEEFSGEGSIVMVLGLAPVAWTVSSIVGSSLSALDRPDIGSHATVAGLGTTVVSGLATIPLWGVMGGAVSLAVGSYVAAAVQTVAFLQLTSKPE